MRRVDTNRTCESAVQATISRPAFAVIAVLTLGAGAGLCLAWDEPAKPESASSGRKAKRPPTARMQMDFATAAKTKIEFRQPAELAYQDFNELVLGAKTFPNGNAGPTGLPSQFQLLCYNDQPVGPTIRVHRGTTFHIHVTNALKNPQTDKAANPKTNDNNEQPHALCNTNLHTHGLHVSPVGIGDNVEFVTIAPGEDFTFEYTIPADHPSGTFWYHPHRHGSVAYQLSNGLAGALIVEGRRGDGIADLEDIPEIAAARERIFVFQLYNYRVDPPGDNGTGRIDATIIYDITPDKRACPAIDVPDSAPMVQNQVTAINGVLNPIIYLAPGEVQRWRLIHAAWDLNRKLYLVDKDGNPAKDMWFHEIALDGLATGTMVAKGNDPASTTTVEIAPGQRSDVLIQAPLLHEGEEKRTYYLAQSDDDPKKPLGQIIVRGARRSMRLPDPRDLVKCQPFAPIRDEELTPAADASEIGKTPLRFLATPPDSPEPKDKWKFQINNKTYTHYTTPIPIRLNTAEEWTIKAVSENHPFHIHVNPFQVVMRIDKDGKCTPMNMWRDTLYIQYRETYVIRSRFKDFLGRTVLHCHFLDHEDQGMMMPIEFVPKTPAAKKGQAGALRPKATAAPALRLADPRGTWHDLTEYRAHNVLLVFFLGMECPHCTEQLAALVRASETRLGNDTKIVAVSSRRILDPDRLSKMLGVRDHGRFHLLVDADCRAFRRVGCYNFGPLHGLFVIDRAGVIRADYIGETPFADTQAVIQRVQELAEAGTRAAAP